MDTILLESTIQTLTNNFKADDVTDYSAITYFSDSISVLKLQGPSATIYNNTNFASPDFNYPGTLTKDITIPLVGGAIPQGSYILTATTRVTKTGVPISSVTMPATILVPLILDGNFIPGQTVTWTGGANAGTYTVSSAVTTAFGVEVTFTTSLVDTTTTGSLSFFETVTTVETYTYCYSAPSTVLTLAADCPTATLDATNSTNYAITCEGQTIQPDSVTATLTLNAPLNDGGSPVYAQTVTALPTGTTYSTTELWTQTWTGTLSSVLTYTLPSGLQIETTITGTTSLNVVCDDSLCCMSSCLLAATNRFTAAPATGNLNTILSAVSTYLRVVGQFMMYSVGVKCGNTTVIDTAVAAMKALLANENCCNNCSDTGDSVQIVAIYNVNVSGTTVIVQSGDVYIDVSAAVVGSTTTYTLTLDTTQLGNLIASYLAANPTVVTNIVNTMMLGTSIQEYDVINDQVYLDGTTVSGSPIISSLVFTAPIVIGDFHVGDQIQHANFPAGTQILTIGTSTITVNQNATATGAANGVYVGGEKHGLIMAKYKKTVSGVTSYVYTIQVQVQNSVFVNSTTSKIELLNDEAAPGNWEAYSTNGSGTKGWNSLFSLLGSQISHNESAGPTTIPNGSEVSGTTLSLAAGTWIIIASAKIVRSADSQIIFALYNGAPAIYSGAVNVDGVYNPNQNICFVLPYASASAISLDFKFQATGVTQTNALRERSLVAIRIA